MNLKNFLDEYKKGASKEELMNTTGLSSFEYPNFLLGLRKLNVITKEIEEERRSKTYVRKRSPRKKIKPRKECQFCKEYNELRQDVKEHCVEGTTGYFSARLQERIIYFGKQSEEYNLPPKKLKYCPECGANLHNSAPAKGTIPIDENMLRQAMEENMEKLEK